jgi:hypothetical protein
MITAARHTSDIVTFLGTPQGRLAVHVTIIVIAGCVALYSVARGRGWLAVAAIAVVGYGSLVASPASPPPHSPARTAAAVVIAALALVAPVASAGLRRKRARAAQSQRRTPYGQSGQRQPARGRWQ